MKFIDKGGAASYTTEIESKEGKKVIKCVDGVINTNDNDIINHLLRFSSSYDVLDTVTEKVEEPVVEQPDAPKVESAVGAAMDTIEVEKPKRVVKNKNKEIV